MFKELYILLKINVERNIFITYLTCEINAIQFIFYYICIKNDELIITQIKREILTLNYNSSDSLLIA